MTAHGAIPDDCYELLGVEHTATADEITRAFRRESKRWHPDVDGGSAERMKAILDAYEVLREPTQRRSYDEKRRTGRAADRDTGYGPDGGPAPYLVPAEIAWTVAAAVSPEPVTVRLSNRGGPFTIAGPETWAGSFWGISDWDSVMTGEDLVDYVIAPMGTDLMTSGSYVDEVTFLLDDVPATLTIRLTVVAPATTPSPPVSAPGPAYGSPVMMPASRRAVSPASAAVTVLFMALTHAVPVFALVAQGSLTNPGAAAAIPIWLVGITAGLLLWSVTRWLAADTWDWLESYLADVRFYLIAGFVIWLVFGVILYA